MIKIAEKVRIEIADPYDMEYSGVGIVTCTNDCKLFVQLCDPINYNGGIITEVEVQPRLKENNLQDMSNAKLFVNGQGKIDPPVLGQYKGYRFFIGSVLREC